MARLRKLILIRPPNVASTVLNHKRKKGTVTTFWCTALTTITLRWPNGLKITNSLKTNSVGENTRVVRINHAIKFYLSLSYYISNNDSLPIEVKSDTNRNFPEENYASSYLHRDYKLFPQKIYILILIQRTELWITGIDFIFWTCHTVYNTSRQISKL